jgi:hypothetical protein
VLNIKSRIALRFRLRNTDSLVLQGEDLEYVAEPNMLLLSGELIIKNITRQQATTLFATTR